MISIPLTSEFILHTWSDSDDLMFRNQVSFGDWAVQVEGPETPCGLTSHSRSLNDCRVTETISDHTILVSVRCMSVPWFEGNGGNGGRSAVQPHSPFSAHFFFGELIVNHLQIRLRLITYHEGQKMNPIENTEQNSFQIHLGQR